MVKAEAKFIEAKENYYEANAYNKLKAYKIVKEPSVSPVSLE